MANQTVEVMNPISGAGGLAVTDLLYVFRPGAPDLNFKATPSDLNTFILSQAPLNKYDAIAAPDADDDDAGTGGDGTFAVGSIWIDITGDEAYRCVDATTGAAVWVNTSLEIGELGSIAIQDANDVTITGGSISGITSLGVVGNIPVTGTVDCRYCETDGTKLDGVESRATTEQTGAEIKNAYEGEADAYTDTKNTKLAGIETLADVTDAVNVDAAGAVMESDYAIVFDISLSSFDNKSFDISSEDTTPRRVFFRADGLKMYVTGDENNTIYQ